MAKIETAIAFAAGLLLICFALFGCTSAPSSNETTASNGGVQSGAQANATLDEEDASTPEADAEKPSDSEKPAIGLNNNMSNKISIEVNGRTLAAVLEDNSSAQALMEMLQDGPLTIEMSDYGNMEKVGPLGHSLPRNDEQITTQPGDIILYQGDKITIYYAPNSWNFTRLGRIEEMSADDLKQTLGSGDTTVNFSLA